MAAKRGLEVWRIGRAGGAAAAAAATSAAAAQHIGDGHGDSPPVLPRRAFRVPSPHAPCTTLWRANWGGEVSRLASCPWGLCTAAGCRHALCKQRRAHLHWPVGSSPHALATKAPARDLCLEVHHSRIGHRGEVRMRDPDPDQSGNSNHAPSMSRRRLGRGNGGRPGEIS